MIKCTFEMCFEGLKIDLNNAVIDNMPKQDKDGNWLPILLKFNLKTIDERCFTEIMSRFYNFNCYDASTSVVYGSATLSVDDDIWNLYNVWPKSLKFDDESNCEILWRFNNAELQE